MVACLNLFWFICALKISVVFVLVFASAGSGFACYAGSLFAAAEGATAASAGLVKVNDNNLRNSNQIKSRPHTNYLNRQQVDSGS